MIEAKKWAQIKVAIIPIVLAIVCIGLAIAVYYSYMHKQGIRFEENTPITSEEILKGSELQMTGDDVRCTIDYKTLDGMLLNQINKAKEVTPELSQIEAVHYDVVNSKLYLSVNKGKAYPYTFSVNAAISLNEEGIIFDLSQYRLGNLGVRVPKGYFKKITGMSEQMIIPNLEKEDLLQLTQIESNEEGVMLTYTYNNNTLVNTFEKYIEQIDVARVAAHTKKQDIHSEYLKIGSEKSINLEKAKMCMSLFAKGMDGVKDFSFMLNKDGQKKIYEDWQGILIKNLTLDEWYTLSENDMSETLNSYHKDFLRCFYEYLYKNESYEVGGNTILVNSSEINYKDIFTAGDYTDYIYDIQLQVEGNQIYALYNVNNTQVKKLLLTRRR